MRKFASLAVVVLLVGLGGTVAAAQCGCSQPDTPRCYTAYWAGTDVSFKLVVPAEYFSQCPMPETPLITGWRVERLDGTIVYQDQFPDVPKGFYLVMTWDQQDAQSNPVAPGFYRIIVQTTTAREFSNFVRVVAPPSLWSGCCCCPQLVSCACCPTFGSPYVQIERPPRRVLSWGSLSITIHLGGVCSCP